MNSFLRDLKQYIKFPEMRILWLFLFLVLSILLIDFVFIDNPLWTFISALILLTIGIFILLNSLRTAKFNLAVRVERNRLDSIIANISDGIVVYDLDFKVMLFNRAAGEIFNSTPSKVVGQLISPDSVKTGEFKVLAQVIFPSLASTIVRRSKPDEYPQVLDISFTEPVLELRVTTHRLADDNGDVFGFLKIVHNRTREVQLLKSKSDFITVAAHQLRTPITALNWTLESLSEEKLTDEQQNLVKTGQGACGNILKTVEDLLAASKIEEGKFGYDFQDVNLIEFLQSVLVEAQAIAKDYKIGVFFEPPAEKSIPVRIDTKRIGLALSNFLNNAVRYNVENGQVVVSVSRVERKPYVQISIADTGVGVPREEMDKLFTRFYRGGNIVTKETSGTGLGLYIAKNIIKRHGGEVWVQSEIDRGSVFYFTLPTDFNLIPSREMIYEE